MAVMQPGQRLGPYVLVRLLGRGGMGAVWEAQDPQGRSVAIKALLEQDDHALRRFEREARVLASVTHPNILRVHEYAGGPAGPYLVTELVPGESLERVCARGPLPPPQAADLVRQLADAVARAHAAGVLHRDLKPHNVILRPDGLPVLLDFGLARQESAERLTQTGALVGTPAYMAPEQAGEGAGAIDERSDVYGLGATLFHLLHARAPFSASGAVQLVKKVMTDAPEWPSPPLAPPDLEAVCRKAMARDPADRYQRAAELRDDLARFLAGEATRARPRARRPWPLVLVLLGIGVGAAAWLVRGEGDGPPQVATDVGAAPVTTRRERVDPRRDPILRLRGFLDEAGAPSLLTAEAAARWLQDFPGHQRAGQARAALQRARAKPTWLATHPCSFPGLRLGVKFLPGRPPRLLTVGDKQVCLWTLDDPSRPELAPRALALDSRAGSLAVEADGAHAWIATARDVRRLTLPALMVDPERTILLPPEVHDMLPARVMALSPDGERLALACGVNYGDGNEPGHVVLVELEERRARVLRPREDEAAYPFAVQSVAFARDGRLWAVAGRMNTFDETDLKTRIDAMELTGEQVRLAAPRPEVTIVTGAPKLLVETRDGELAVGTTAHDLSIVKVAEGRVAEAEVIPMRGHMRLEQEHQGSEVPSLLDGDCFERRWLVLITARPSSDTVHLEDDRLLVFDLDRRDVSTTAWEVEGLGDRGQTVDVSDDGRLVVVALVGGALKVYPFLLGVE